MRKTNAYLASLLSVSLVAYLSACGGSSGGDAPEPPVVPQYTYQPPTDIGDGWDVGDLNQLGVDPSTLENLINSIEKDEFGFRFVDSVAIAYQGQLVFHQRTRDQLDFADGWADNTDIDLHVLNSVTKSFTSALVGIAIDQGYISGIDVPVHDYFQDKLPIENWDQSKQSMTLENWLNMRHGYIWDEWNVSYLDPSNQNSQMNASIDAISFLLDLPMETEPGSKFVYSTGVSYGIGRIVQEASGRSVQTFLREELLTPLDINKFDYWTLNGQLHTGSALYLTTRDMLKFGQLYLDGGNWNGNQIISSAWVQQSTEQQVDFNSLGTSGYGYQWWHDTYTSNGQNFKSFYASGFGGQFIFVFPELDLVVAMTGGAYEAEQWSQRNITDILQQHILPGFVPN